MSDDTVFNGLLIGFLSGLAVALGGAIKDAPYEGFDPAKFLRSPIIGAFEGAALNSAVEPLNPVVLFFAVIGTERITTETYKLARAKMPMKFKYGEWSIPKTLKSGGNAWSPQNRSPQAGRGT